jgi:hypothetical protein
MVHRDKLEQVRVLVLFHKVNSQQNDVWPYQAHIENHRNKKNKLTCTKFIATPKNAT